MVLKKPQQPPANNHINSQFHHNKNPRPVKQHVELLDSSQTPTKFSIDNNSSSALSSVVTSPASSVRSASNPTTAAKRMQTHQRPQPPAASTAASTASTPADNNLQGHRNNGHRVNAASPDSSSLDPLLRKRTILATDIIF
jgi:hypothetical protein